MRSFFDEVVAFTSTEPARGERFTIVSFADSDDKAVRRLRDEVRLSPPEGGAILRIYQSRQAMPEEIGSLFRGQVEGITRWCRFIAVDAENKSPQELEDTISHELAHAYICSLLGLSNDNLPRWFHEGVALYLSDAKDRYVSQTRFGTERIAWSPHDYEEFKLIFNYLDSTLGEQSIAEFIREAVRQRAIDGPLRTIIGAANYTELRDLALEWKSRNQKIMLLATGGALFLLIAALMWRGRRRQLKIKAAGEREFERAEKEKQQYAVKVVEELEQMQDSQTMVELLTHERDAMLNAEKMALELVAEGRALAKSGNRAAAKDKFNHALSIAPWSPGVKNAVQQAVNEMNGIHL
jgi:hypothetical protein